MVLGVHAQAVQKGRRVGLRFPAVHVREFGLQLRRSDAVLVGEVLLHVDRVLLLHDLEQARVPAHDRVENGVVVIAEMILLQEGQALARRDRHEALRRLELAREDLQERRLSGAVRADDAVAVSLGEFDVYVLEERLFTETQSDVIR